MRKLLAILLISLLSLQASWAAAASYCRHEQGAAARHFGHHEHQHHPHWAKLAGQAKAAPVLAEAADTGHGNDAADGIGASLTGADLDCSVCHAHALPGVPSAPSLSALEAPLSSNGPLIQRQPPSVPQPRPERPNWLAA